jgi:hypothetical protein
MRLNTFAGMMAMDRCAKLDDAIGLAKAYAIGADIDPVEQAKEALSDGWSRLEVLMMNPQHNDQLLWDIHGITRAMRHCATSMRHLPNPAHGVMIGAVGEKPDHLVSHVVIPTIKAIPQAERPILTELRYDLGSPVITEAPGLEGDVGEFDRSEMGYQFTPRELIEWATEAGYLEPPSPWVAPLREALGDWRDTEELIMKIEAEVLSPSLNMHPVQREAH